MTTTTTLSDTRAWLTDPTDPGGASVRCGTRRGGSMTDALDGELVQYAGQRRELESYDSGTVTLPITFAGISGTALAQIRAWKGCTLLLRTTDGQRYYGGYLSVGQVTMLLAGPLYDAEVSFLVTTDSDVV